MVLWIEKCTVLVPRTWQPSEYIIPYLYNIFIKGFLSLSKYNGTGPRCALCLFCKKKKCSQMKYGILIHELFGYV